MRYLKLYLAYAKNSLMGKMIYKSNFIIGVIAFLFTQTFALLTLFLLINSVPNIDGYGIYEIGFLFGLTNMAVSIDHLLSDRLWNVSYFEVKSGRLDHLFLRPLPVLFQVLASEIQLEALGEMIVAVVLIITCGMNITASFTVSSVILLIIGIICAALIITSFKLLIASLAFVFQRSGPLLQFVYNFSTYAKYPLTIFPKVIQFILLFIIPLGLCLFIPFANLCNPKNNVFLIALCIFGFAIMFAAMSLWVWCKLAKKYESSGT